MRSALTRRVSLFKLRPSLAPTPYYCIWKGRDNADFGSSGLIAEARANGDALAPLGTTADSTALPALVFMRERNPCVFER